METKQYCLVTKNIIFASLIFLLSGCSSTPTPKPFHYIIGTETNGWDKTPEINIRVIKDLQVNELRVRQVRRNNNRCKSGYIDHIELQGSIGPDSTKILERILNVLPYCETQDMIRISPVIYLASGGGLLSDGFAMGELFRKKEVTTEIAGNATCASSCAIAFLGGKFRQMDPSASLAFHAPYTLSSSNLYGATTKSIDCSDRGQVAMLKDYYFKMLSPKDGRFLLDRTLAYCSMSDGWTINKDAANLFGLTTH